MSAAAQLAAVPVGSVAFFAAAALVARFAEWASGVQVPAMARVVVR